MQLANVGPATAGDLLLLGIRSLSELRGRDAFELYDALCRKTRERHDPCVIDVFLALVDHANGAPERPWWTYTAERKRLTARRAAGKPRR
ncbi:MAG: mitomycin resistance protein [Planctomycetota bacterium]|nr:MAG: mitomycin resistance protein [Planctomycetota bacterium]